MSKHLKILHLEDLQSDAKLISQSLTKAKIDFETLVVDTRMEFVEALSVFSPDIILSDHSLPSFNSHDALQLVRDAGLKIPFILITANVSEEFAVDVIKRGADDYILKDRLKRLPSAINNCLEKYRLEKEQQNFLNELIRNERHYRALIENIHDAIILVNEKSELVYQSPSTVLITGFNLDELKGVNVFDHVHPDDKKDCLALFHNAAATPGISLFNQYRILHKNGRYIWIEGTITNLLHDESVKAFIVNYRDITLKKNAEQALVKSEFRYRQMIETAQEGVWVIDENNKTTFVNLKMCEILGYTKEEMIGKNVFEFMDEAARTEVPGTLEWLSKKTVENVEVRYITKSGKQIWTSIASNPVFDEFEVYKGALAMVSDITAKRNLEDVLERVNNLARIGNWNVDLEKNITYWSGVTRQIHEVETDFDPSLPGAIDFYKEGDSRILLQEALKQGIEKGIPWDLELQLITGKLNERWVRVTGEAEFHNGKCTRIYGSIQDIDSRKKAQLEVLKIYEEKNIILESIGDAFFAVDNNWVVTYWNKEAEKLIGFAKNDIVGHNFWEIFSFRLDSESYRMYHQAKQTNEVVHFEDYYDPKNKWYEVSAYPSANGLAVYFRDITERKLTWIQLNALNETLHKNARELATSNAELEQFAYVASHDLQEPLRMVTSFLTQIEKKYGNILDEKGKKYIYFAVDGAKRMRRIILDLLEFSRVGRLESKLETVDVQELLTDVTALCQKQVEETNGKVSFISLPVISTYKIPLRQIFQNLLSNALKYHTPGVAPEIIISSLEREDEWEFSVSDNGIAIEKEYFEKIFVIFQRLHNKDEYVGTGMGLAICKKIVETMGGKIWLQSAIGKGSTFFFTIKKIR